jgi:hypothetical protein
MRITALHKTDAEHLDRVAAEMKELGAPTIRAIETAYGLVAFEGVHRLAAAALLKITPEIIVIEDGETVADHGLQDFEGQALTVGEIADYIGIPEGATYTDEDFEEE